MKIQKFSSHPYLMHLTTGKKKEGALLKLYDSRQSVSTGDISPLPGLSKESLRDALDDLSKKKHMILSIDWSLANCFEYIKNLELFPSAEFALESAILELVDPTPCVNIPACALLMGSPHEILKQAEERKTDGYAAAKVKIGNLRIKDAKLVIDKLKDAFVLRIDVNRAWNTKDALDFFSGFPLNAFDYVEEPFQNPKDLKEFSHPLAIDESFPNDLCLEDLENLPSLKALIYKPTVQGGIGRSLALKAWSEKKNISFILSSSFESLIGIKNIVSMAYRLKLSKPIGIGTRHFISTK